MLTAGRSDIGTNAPEYITGNIHRKKIINDTSNVEKVFFMFFDSSFFMNEKNKIIIGTINK